MAAIQAPEPLPRPRDRLGLAAEYRELIDEIVDALPCVVFIKNAADLTYSGINRVAQDLFGIAENELLGKADDALFSREEVTRIQANDRRVIASRTAGPSFEEELEARFGTRWFRTRNLPVLKVKSLPDVLVTFSEDITEAKELVARSGMWDQVFRHAERGIVVGAPAGTTLELMNPAFALMHGSTIEAMAGTPLINIFAPEVRAGIPALFELVRREGQHTFESVCIRVDGTRFPVLVDATSVKDAQGEVHHRAIRIQDTTLLKSTELRLRADRTEAERANEAKSQFLSRMSHELRTPLNVILGFAQVMQLDQQTAAQTESLGHILHAGRHLLTLIDEALDISRVESGKLSVSLESVSVPEALEEVITLMQPLAEKSGVRLMHDCAQQSTVLADRQRLKQVLLNLVANGINYNVYGGYVRISCTAREDMVEISVSDTGVGFAQDQTDRLFAPFDRLGKEAGPIEGSGLGLSLSKALVEAMGGSISAARNDEAGSTFAVLLKKSELSPAVAAYDARTVRTPGTASGLILYIEDNLANFRLVEAVLSRRPGMRILPAMQAGIGLQLAIDHQPDLIILDLHLPDFSGEEALKRLVHNPHTRSIPVIIASADAAPGRSERLLQLGARAYLTKPIDIALLLETIDGLLDGSAAVTHEPA